MNTKKMIAVMAVLAMAVAAFAFVPAEEPGANPIASTPEEIVYLHGDVTSQLTQTAEQIVIVDADLNIKDGGSVSIAGKLIVNEGVTITIDAKSYEGLGSSKEALSVTGDAEINGNIVSKSNHGLKITPGTGKEVIINGTVTALGDTSGTAVQSATITADISEKNVVVNGNIVIGTNAKATLTQVFFEKAGALTVLGEVNGAIGLIGSAYFDGASTTGLKIYIADAAAKIEVASFTGTLTVTDMTMFAYAYGGVQYYVGAVPSFVASTTPKDTADAEFNKDPTADKKVAANEIVLVNATNVKIAETITTSMAYDEDHSKNMMCAETKMTVSSLDSAKAVAAVDGFTGANIKVSSGSETVYFETMTIVDMNVDIQGKATVVGDITFPVSSPAKLFIVTGGLTVEGLVLIKNEIIYGESKVIAAKYTIKDADNKVDAYYTTVQKAIDNGATDITLMGQLVVEKDLTIPAPVKLTTADSLKTTPAQKEADCAVVIREGATFAIANGAQFIAQGDVDVEGTFVIENIDYGITLKLIWADVELKDGSYIMYTNLANAFVKAEAGAELCAYNPVNRTISIKDDLILPAGMSFSNYSEYNSAAVTVAIDNGATFTIAGKLIVHAKSELSAVGGNSWNSKTPATDAGAVKDYSVIVIGAQGVIEFTTGDAPAYSDFKIAGAYYTMDGKSYIANIPLAFGLILDTDACTVDVAGEVAIENIKVAGTEKDRIIVNIVAGADVTMKGFTFAYGTIIAKVGATLTGDIGTATGKMIFNEAKITGTAAVFTEEFLDDAMNFAVAGGFESENATSVSGVVYFKGVVYHSVGELQMKDFENQRLTVPAGAKLFIIGDTFIPSTEVYIAGDLTVTNTGVFSGNDASIVSVLGTMTVEKVDGKSGKANFYRYCVGGSTNDLFTYIPVTTHGTGVLGGQGTFNDQIKTFVLIVAGGATVSADVLVDWMAADTTKNTEFYMEGKLWATVYIPAAIATTPRAGVAIMTTNTDGVTYPNIIPSLDDVKFNGWQTYDEKTKTYATITPDKGTTAWVGQAGLEKVYADLTKEIYTINVNADQGIDNVYIDGVLMTKTVATNSYTAKVAAGTHTLSYALANGYSGNAVITSIDGAKLVGGGLSFVVNDDKYDGPMDITLSGIQKSGYDVDPETHEEKSTGLTVTEILLIVVVIIMAVMAVVLIMRLNRS